MDKKVQFMMGVAILASRKSTCDRLKVGAVVCDKDLKTIHSYGYNGNYSGGPNKCDNPEEGNCSDIHAEINALIKPNREKGEIMFITDSPCLMCAKSIINAGIKKVYYLREYRDSSGLKLLKKANVGVVKVKGDLQID